MQVILLTDVKKLGFSGDVVDVSPGYARNYLFPKRFATSANAPALSHARKIQSERIKTQEEVLQKAREVVSQLKKITLSFSKKLTAKGHLYGSVAEKDIVAELKKSQKIEVSVDQVKMKEHIKEEGSYTVQLNLGEEVDVSIAVEVRGEEAQPKKETKAKKVAKKVVAKKK